MPLNLFISIVIFHEGLLTADRENLTLISLPLGWGRGRVGVNHLRSPSLAPLPPWGGDMVGIIF